MDKSQVKEFRMKYATIIARCWQDEEWKKQFIENPKKILAEEEIAFDEKKNYKVIQADKFSTYIVLPYEEGQEALQIFYKELNSLFGKSQQIIKPGCELRVVQNTPDTNYLVIPYQPDLYTEDEKMVLSKADGVCHVESDVEAIAEELAVMVTTVVEAGEAVTSLFVVIEGFIVVV